MKSKVLVVVLATLSIPGLWLLFVPRGVQEEPKIGRPMVAVVVPKVDIPAGTDMDQLIRDDQFRLILVLQENAVDGAVLSIDQLSHKHVTVSILAGEPILAGWLKSGAERDSS